jgi:anti-sigma factor RsiW
MKCEDVSNNLISYLDRRTSSADRSELEDHLGACAECRVRAEEFRKIWSVMEELPVIEPSLGFDAHVRERVAAEPRRGWFGLPIPKFVPGFMLQPRLVFSAALLIALCVWTARPLYRTPAPVPAPQVTAQNDMEQFQEINDLGVLENYDVLTKLDALSELAPVSARSTTTPSTHQHAHDNGGA